MGSRREEEWSRHIHQPLSDVSSRLGDTLCLHQDCREERSGQ